MASEESKSWVEEALSRAAYPEKYNYYLEKGIKSLKEMESEDIADIEAIKVLIPLDPLQTRVLDDIEFLCRLDIFGGQSHQMWTEQDKWLEEHPNNISCNKRVDALLPIMENPAVPDKLKETLWYGLFLFNDYYAEDYIPPIK